MIGFIGGRDSQIMPQAASRLGAALEQNRAGHPAELLLEVLELE